MKANAAFESSIALCTRRAEVETVENQVFDHRIRASNIIEKQFALAGRSMQQDVTRALGSAPAI
jgi:hypothetical protein